MQRLVTVKLILSHFLDVTKYFSAVTSQSKKLFLKRDKRDKVP